MIQKNKDLHVFHKCFGECEKFYECSTCPISVNNYCKDFQKLLKGFNYELESKHHLKSFQDRQDIISNTIVGIMKSIEDKIRDNIEIKNFKALMRQIHNFKRSDFFRGQPNFSGNNKVGIDLAYNIDLEKIKRIERSYNEYIKIDCGDVTLLESLSMNLPSLLKRDLLGLSDNIEWNRKVKNFFKFNGTAVIEREGDQRKTDDNDDKKDISIESYSKTFCLKEHAISPERLFEILINQIDQIQTKTAKTCANLFREYLKVFKEDRSLKEIAPALGITANAVSQKLRRCRELLYNKSIKGIKDLCSLAI